MSARICIYLYLKRYRRNKYKLLLKYTTLFDEIRKKKVTRLQLKGK